MNSEILVKFKGDTKDLESSTNKAQTSVNSLSSGLSKGLTTAAGVAATAIAAATAAVVGLSKSTWNGAKEMAAYNSSFTEADNIGILNILNTVVVKYLTKGYSVELPFGSIRPAVQDRCQYRIRKFQQWQVPDGSGPCRHECFSMQRRGSFPQSLLRRSPVYSSSHHTFASSS